MINESATAVLLLGSNIGDRALLLSGARMLIENEAGTIMFRSGLYETEAWGKTDQPPFLNQALIIQTELSPALLLKSLLGIETELGRTREVKWGQRTLDIDILYYDSDVIASTDLKIPHPGLADRRFALVPLCELMPDYIHPVLNVSNEELLKRCKDTLEVKRLLEI